MPTAKSSGTRYSQKHYYPEFAVYIDNILKNESLSGWMLDANMYKG